MGGASNVIIALHLFSSLERLSAGEQAQVNGFITSFIGNPAHPGLKLERVGRARSEQVWAGRASSDLRVILFKDAGTWAILYADHHDSAYEWARRREIGRHTVTGSLQIVESVETVREVVRVTPVRRQAQTPGLFAAHSDAYLLSLGVPDSWLPALRQVSDDDQLLVVCEKLPVDVADRLLSVAAGQLVMPPRPAARDQPLSTHAGTRGQFYVVTDAAELAAVLAAPMERWIAFLHPSQRALVERAFSGPAKVSGSAGTGKTVVAMHRARHLARQGEQVFLTSFMKTLTENIERNLQLLCTEGERRRITVATVHKQALDLIRQADPSMKSAGDDLIPKLLEKHRQLHAPGWEPAFLRAEWDHVVRLQGIDSWEGYRDAARKGRSHRLSLREREVLWKVFGRVLEELERRKVLDWPGMPQRACELIASGSVQSPYTAVIVDEVQDLRPPELKFVHALCAAHPGNLMLCGDAGQRIYPGGFSLGALGIDVRGRSQVLRLNYRTTEQIRRTATQVRGPVADDMDGGTEHEEGTRSLLRGPVPVLRGYAGPDEEIAAAVVRIKSWLARGVEGGEIGAFARTGALVAPLGEALTAAGISWRRLSGRKEANRGAIQIDTMNRAKGLEFKAVLLLACSSDALPDPSACSSSPDPLDQEAALARERQLLYVAMTRARDELVVSWSGPPSPFIGPLLGAA